MKIITIATGTYFEKATSLKASIPDLIIISDEQLLDAHKNANPIIQSRLAKTGFASYLPSGISANEQILLVDADLEAKVENPLDTLPTINADISGIRLPVGPFGFPPPFNAIPATAPRISSGFLIFANLATAQAISAAWNRHYISKLPFYADGYSLSAALAELNSTVVNLDPVWNSFGLRDGIRFYHNLRKN